MGILTLVAKTVKSCKKGDLINCVFYKGIDALRCSQTERSQTTHTQIPPKYHIQHFLGHFLYRIITTARSLGRQPQSSKESLRGKALFRFSVGSSFTISHKLPQCNSGHDVIPDTT